MVLTVWMSNYDFFYILELICGWCFCSNNNIHMSLLILYLCYIKALKWNVFTDASARRLVVGQG